MYDLKEKVIVVAGASSGIGRETAKRMAELGAIVIATARRVEQLQETMQEIDKVKGVGEAYPCDFMVPEEVEKLAEYVMNKYGKIDVWVNGVGVNNAMGITWEISYDEWMKELHGNLKTCYIGSKCAINQMRKQGFGRIINMSGGGVVKPETYNSAYACSKTAIVRFTEGLAIELEAENVPIEVFAFGPGLITTQRTIDLINDPATMRFMPGIIAPIKEGKTTPIEEPAEFLAFIASGAVDKLKGCLLTVHMDKEELVKNADKIVEDGSYKIIVKGLS